MSDKVIIPKLLDTIKDEVKATLQPIQIESIKFIDNIDFSEAAKRASLDLKQIGKELNTELLEQGVLVLKQYYSLAILDSQNYQAINEALDDSWYHVLFTRDYKEFCSNRMSEVGFHNSSSQQEEIPVVAFSRCYDFTMECWNKILNFFDNKFYTDNPVDVLSVAFFLTASKLEEE